MSIIHVCDLASVADLASAVRPSHVLSVLGGMASFPPTPAGVAAEDHLCLTVSDIIGHEEGMVAPALSHVDEIIAFGKRWAGDGRGKPMIVHCFAGVSRSTASTLSIACALRPNSTERAYTEALRKASASAQPNALMIRHADTLLARDGRLIRAVAAMGPGDFSRAGRPFRLALDL